MSHGSGTFFYSDGARFEGHFNRDQKHGPGMMFLPSGEIFSEHWLDGKRISSVSIKPQQMPNNRANAAMHHQPQPPPQPPGGSAKLISRNIRLAAQEQLQLAQAMSARGVRRV